MLLTAMHVALQQPSAPETSLALTVSSCSSCLQEDVIIDEERDTVVAHYTATAAHLLPSRDGVVATGCVSTVQGMDKFRFNRFGHCSSIESYRQRFADEEEQLQTIDWDSS